MAPRTSLPTHLARLAPVTRQQLGVFTTAQAAELGVPRQRVADLRRADLVRQLYTGVHALTVVPESWEQRALAGQLAAGPLAAVSGLAAARLHDLSYLGARRSLPALEWAVPRGAERVGGPPVVTEVHLTAGDVVSRGPWRLTSVPWTIFTQAHRLGVERTERAVDAAVADGRTATTALGSTAARFRFCTGMPVIREVMQRHDPAVRLTRSEAERRFFRGITGAGLPAPTPNLRVLDAYDQVRYLDFAYEAWFVMIEIDVHRDHLRAVGRHHDGHRQNGLVPPWIPLRFDELDLVYDLPRVVTDVRRALVAVGAIPA